ncbi:MAG: hypothetical protein KDN19_11410, partial [Verrucomicrobiae bacterium]|nr:hypothetical protein [Verrucomicrobiae bacterium]
KQAIWEINRNADDATKRAMNEEMRKVYDETDQRTKKDLADRLNAEQKKRIEAAEKAGNHELAKLLKEAPEIKPDDIEVFNPTNPTAEVKVGADRDVTMRVKPSAGQIVKVPQPGNPSKQVAGRVNADGTVTVRGSDGKDVQVKAPDIDVPHSMLKEAYEKNFYETVTGKKASEASPEDVSNLAKEYDQACTDRLHPEAYGSRPEDLDTAMHHPDRDFSDPEQVGQAASYKGQEKFKEAEDQWKAGKYKEAESSMAEGMRQMTKQWKNQVLKRRDAVAGPPRNANLPPIDSKLQKAVSIMDDVVAGKISPADAEGMLLKLGHTPISVANDVGKQLEMLQKFWPGGIP